MATTFIVLDADKMRLPLATDRLKVQLTEDARKYIVANFGHSPATANVVMFAQTAAGKRLGRCTCEDFANIHMHGKQCKHIRCAAGLHLARNKAKLAVDRQANFTA